MGERSLDDLPEAGEVGRKRVRRNATSAESTLGGGRKTERETGWNPVRAAASWIRTETAP